MVTIQLESVSAVCMGSLCKVILAETIGVSPDALDMLQDHIPTVETLDMRKLQREDPQIYRVIQYLDQGKQPDKKTLKKEHWVIRRLLGEWKKLVP